MGIEWSANAGVEKYEGVVVVVIVVLPGRTRGDLSIGCGGFRVDAIMLETLLGASMLASRRIYNRDWAGVGLLKVRCRGDG